MRFKLPVVSIPQKSKIHSGIPNAQGPLPGAAVLPSEPASDIQETAAAKSHNDGPSRQYCLAAGPCLKPANFAWYSPQCTLTVFYFFVCRSSSSNCQLVLVPNLARENVATESQGCNASKVFLFQGDYHALQQLLIQPFLGKNNVRPYKNKEELLEMRASLTAMRASCEHEKVSMTQYQGSMQKLQVQS